MYCMPDSYPFTIGCKTNVLLFGYHCEVCYDEFQLTVSFYVETCKVNVFSIPWAVCFYSPSFTIHI